MRGCGAHQKIFDEDIPVGSGQFREILLHALVDERSPARDMGRCHGSSGHAAIAVIVEGGINISARRGDFWLHFLLIGQTPVREVGHLSAHDGRFTDYLFAEGDRLRAGLKFQSVAAGDGNGRDGGTVCCHGHIGVAAGCVIKDNDGNGSRLVGVGDFFSKVDLAAFNQRYLSGEILSFKVSRFSQSDRHDVKGHPIHQRNGS
ncbi:hypothetical protein DSECCO2_296460 [anaerobic digester metagenome]